MGRVVFEGMIFFNDTVSKHQNVNVFRILSNLVEIPQRHDENIYTFNYRPHATVVCKDDVIVGSHDLGTCMR